MNEVPGIQEADLQAYMSEPLAKTVTDKHHRNHLLGRYQTIRDLYMLRRMMKEEFESYTDAEFRNDKLNLLQRDFRDNYIERLTVLELLREIGEPVNDLLIPEPRKKNPADKVEEGEVLEYMSKVVPSSELATEQDHKDYFRRRISEVEDNYKYLKLQQEEAERLPDKAYREKTMNKLKTHYRHNYLERVTVVTALRRLGEKVEDRFVAISKI